MAKPYRRRKGKTGPLVGNYRVTIDGRDINLRTKDAQEANARARLAKQGKWPVIPAAVDAALNALDPGRSTTIIPDPPLAELEPEEGTAAGDSTGAEPPARNPPPAAEPEPSLSEKPEPLNSAARAAAEEAAGRAGEELEHQAEQLNGVNTELAGVMSELTGGKSGGDLLDGLADGGAAFLLWAEGKAIELGINWGLARRKIGKRLVTKQPEQGSIMRTSLRVGLKGMALTYFPDFATSLTPGWAVAIGLIGGATIQVMEGQLVDVKTGKAEKVGEAIAQAQAAGAEQGPSEAPPAPAPVS